MWAWIMRGRRNLRALFSRCNLLQPVIRVDSRLIPTNCINSSCWLFFRDNRQTARKVVTYPFLLFKNKMSTDVLNAVPSAEIDPDGTFKYILVKVYAPQTPDGTEPSKLIIRGNKRGPYHADIYDETVKILNELNLDSECIGGGKIQHNSAEKKINIYGSSQGFGKADHEVSAQILMQAFPSYEITWNNDSNQ